MTLLQLFFFGLILVSLVSAVSQTSSAIVSAGQTKNISLFLNKGEQVTGSINVSGGNEEIYFSIKDPQGSEVLTRTQVLKGGTFTLDAGQDGAYSVIFDNSLSPDVDKSVILSYSKNYLSTAQRQEDTSCYSWFFILGILGIVFVLRNE
jgi:hypothetical protein